MTAREYPVTFGYLEKWGDYLHRGLDRPCPTGTPVVIEGTTIGLTGNSGLSTGPHLHTQSGKDEWVQATVHPERHEFKAGTVTHAGYGTEWGNFVIVKGTDGYSTCYAHLSQIKVQPGQKVGNMGTTRQDLDAIYKYGPLRRTRGRGEGEDVYLGKPANFVLTDHANSREGKAELAEKANLVKQLDQTKSELKRVRKELTAALSKLNNGSTQADLEKAVSKVAELEKRLREAESGSITQNDWVVLWNKILSFFKRR